MDSGWLSRFRWRRRGAWLWPAFVALDAGRRRDRAPAAAGGRQADDRRGGAGGARAQPDRGDSAVPAARRAAAAQAAGPAADRGARLRRHDRRRAGVGRAARSGAGASPDGRRASRPRCATRSSAPRRSSATARRTSSSATSTRVDTFAIQPGSIYRICVPRPRGVADLLRDRQHAAAVRAQRQVRGLRAQLVDVVRNRLIVALQRQAHLAEVAPERRQLDAALDGLRARGRLERISTSGWASSTW